MENKINLVEILKDILKNDIPRDTELYSPAYGTVYLRDIISDDKFPIKVNDIRGNLYSFTKYGYLNPNNVGECMLYPSKDCNTWKAFKSTKNQIIYRIGDVVVVKIQGMVMEVTGFVQSISNDVIYVNDMEKTIICDTTCGDTIELASDYQLENWNKKLHKNHMHYSKHGRKIIDWFLPFDKVLVRSDICEPWSIEFFGKYHKERLTPYQCLQSSYKYCIPYEGNENFLRTN